MSSSHLSAQVYNLRYEAHRIISVELRPANGLECFPMAEAGAHIDLHLGNGLVRSYSLTNPGEQHRYLVAVLDDPGSRGGSRFVHEQLRVGQVIGIGAPRNHFRLEEEAPASVLIAGGIGITPLLAMLRRLVALGKPARLVYCGRSRQGAAFLAEIDALARSAVPGRVSVELRFDDEQGCPPDMGTLLAGHAPGTHFYCCGPTPMIDAFEAACKALGCVHAHTERFKAAPAPEPAASAGYTVELRRSGKSFAVAAGVSLLDALQAQGAAPPLSCREGLCGTCETRVLEGEVEHRDAILTEAERKANRSMMVCVSSGRCGRLVLDL
jgi:ferredoxin-NADP reductase